MEKLFGVINEKTQEISCINFTCGQFADEVTLCLGKEYEVKVENGKTIVAKKKPQYPKTYEACCKVLGKSPILNCPNLCICERHPETFERKEHFSFREEMSETHIAFLKLLTCRDAYWEIAGVQMKLGKHWEPDWAHGNEKFYCISTSENEIVSGEWYIDNKIIAFPTEEICVVFYDNFKELINSCKELL